MNNVRQDISTGTARTSPAGYGAALFLICSLYTGAAHAQDSAPADTAAQNSTAAKADAAEATEAAKDEILVVAHKQHGAVATDLPPEATLNSATIGSLGAADLEEVFEDLAPEIKNGESGPGQTAQTPIVLVNGQRIAGFTTIRDLPPEAVRRIEIFPEKVALQYGYGADQRVVNIVLRENYNALTVLGRYTIAPDNWRGIYRAKADLVRIDENGHWNIDLDYRHLDPIFAGTTLAGPPGSPNADTAVPAHTLAAQNDALTVSGDATRNFGPLTAELTGRLDLGALQSRLGLADEDGALLEQQGSPNLISGPRYRSDQTVEAQTNLTLNGKLDSWRWSFIGKLDDSTRVTRTFDSPAAGDFDSILLPSPTLLGYRCAAGPVDDCVSTTTREATGDFYLNGNLFALPAGPVIAAFRTGFAFSGIRSNSPVAPLDTDRNREEGNVQANLDFPITSRDSAIGKLSLGVNGEARQVSDFGTLSTLGSSLEWAPVEPVQITASYRREEQAPSLTQLDEATLLTPDLRELDFVTGDTSIIQRIEGGNSDLQRETSRIANARIQVKPFRSTDLTLSAEYTLDRTRNPITTITAATSAAMAAFPDRFTRNDEGYLTTMDVSPVNLARRDQQQVRWGLNYSTAFGSARPISGTTTGAKVPLARDQFQIALYDTWRLQDNVVLRDGLPSLNLLGGDFLSDMGGTPTHELELQTTLSMRTWSADINAQWQTHTSAPVGTLEPDRLTFSQGITVNLRLQFNLSYQHWLTRLLPFLRGNLNISADNVLGAHTTVRDSRGVVPLAYGESYLNPTGRTFRITLRKRFR
jgi:hypothetical protein